LEVLIGKLGIKSLEQQMPSTERNKPKDPIETRREKDKTAHITVKYLVESLQAAQRENELLKTELLKSKQIPSNKIGFLLLIIGVLSLAGSIVASSSALAFIGLGLTFWGILFFFIKPIKFVKGTLLESTAISSYTTIDRIIEALGFKGRAMYIPPYPKEVYLPEYLKGLKEMVVLISAEETTAMPSVEEMARKQFMLENPKGICITPPGLGVMTQLEKELRNDFTKVNPKNLTNILPKLIVNNLELARNVEIHDENNLTQVRIEESIYKDLYSSEHKLKSVHLLGCPLASAVACSVSKATGKPVTITKDSASPDLGIIKLWFQTLEA